MQSNRRRYYHFLIGCAAAAMLLVGGGAARAADIGSGWGQWWLPPVRSAHGSEMDSLFLVTFWICMVVFVAVETTLVVFLIKYRRRKDKAKAYFTHGNARLEMAWTLTPALILAGLAVGNKGVWDRMRFNPDENRPDKATILVIAQQFKWNVIYPGKDGKLGRYLIYPKPTDSRWPGGITFAGVKGPNALPYQQAFNAINSYIDQINPLGKDFDDPDGKDDDWSKIPGRDICIPAHRPVEVQLGSRDVIHDFFLPNFRVKLDAVPGMRGKIVFTATMTSREREQASKQVYPIDELARILSAPIPPELDVSIDSRTPGAVEDKRRHEWLYPKDPSAKRPVTIIRDGRPLTSEVVAQLKTAGIKQIVAYEPGYWDVVCEQFCGQGHYTMQGRLVVLDPKEYNEKFEGGRRIPTAEGTD